MSLAPGAGWQPAFQSQWTKGRSLRTANQSAKMLLIGVSCHQRMHTLIVKIFQTNRYESKRWERRTFVHRRWLVRRGSFMTSARARQPFMADQSVGQPVLLDGEVALSVDSSTVQDRHWSGKGRFQSLVLENNQDLTIAPARAEGEDRSEGGGRKRITSTTTAQ